MAGFRRPVRFSLTPPWKLPYFNGDSGICCLIGQIAAKTGPRRPNVNVKWGGFVCVKRPGGTCAIVVIST